MPNLTPLFLGKTLFILLFLVLAAQGQQRIAVMGTEDDGEPHLNISDLSYLTDRLREAASNTLQHSSYIVMTQQSIVDRLGSFEQAVKICKESTCLVDLGRKVNADYVAQARTGRFSGNVTIKVELYRVANGALIGSFTGESENIRGLLTILDAKAPALFGRMPSVSSEPVPPTPASVTPPAPAKKRKPVAAQPQLLPLVQALRESSLPVGCVTDFASLLKEEGFGMRDFVKDLPPAVAKVKAQMKSPFGKPDDGDKTSVGLSVGCVKSLPESPAEIQALLRDIALKAGLDFAEEAVESYEEPKGNDGEEKGVRFGIRVGYNINNFSFGYKDWDRYIETGYSYGVGLALNFELTSIVKFNTGLDIYYRQLFGGDGYMDEVSISVPVLLQFGNSFYLATGIQLDFPFETSGNMDDYFDDNRSSMDFGLVLGVGYRFTNLGLDFRYVYGLTGIFKDFHYYNSSYKDKSWLGQYCFGLSYFF